MRLLAILLLAGLFASHLEAAEKPDAKRAHLTSIPGINEATEAKLNAAGINNVNDLLAEGATRSGREEMAARSGLSAEQILKFVHCADLFRINGIGGRMAALLDAAGVNGMAALAQHSAAKLQFKLQEVNGARKVTAKVPTETHVAEWIDEANRLPKVVSY